MSKEKKKQDKLKVVPIAEGKTHLQNKILLKDKCYICKELLDEDTVLLRIQKKDMAFAHTYHLGVVREFVKQYRSLPLGWKKEIKKEDDNARESTSSKT